MKMKLVLTIPFLLLLGACTDPSGTKRILTQEGMTDIHITGYSFFACGQDDTYSTGFTATNMNGKRVSGTICAGLMKGYTIRYN